MITIQSLEIMLMQSFNQSFLIVLYSTYSNLHKLHLKSEIWSSHGVGGGYFMDLVCLARHLCIFPSCQQKSQCKQFICLSIRLPGPAPACLICQRCTVIFSLRVSVCITVIKTSREIHLCHNKYVEAASFSSPEDSSVRRSVSLYYT